MFSNWIFAYRPEGVTGIRYLQPYFTLSPKGRYQLVYVELLSDALQSIGRWYRENMPVNLCRQLEGKARQEAAPLAPSARVVPTSPVTRKIGR
jgi:hypothetical protein